MQRSDPRLLGGAGFGRSRHLPLPLALARVLAQALAKTRDAGHLHVAHGDGLQQLLRHGQEEPRRLFHRYVSGGVKNPGNRVGGRLATRSLDSEDCGPENCMLFLSGNPAAR